MMKILNGHIDTGSLIVMGITLVLFVLALFTKGMTHDLFLEAGVFLVSVKIIMSTYKLSIDTKNIQERLDEISKSLSKKE
ncbi:MAG: hypothetical protein VX777_02470 [Chlamydiota bacterium]|nr:hypothetical protein [Chlamydiota bacterium]